MMTQFNNISLEELKSFKAKKDDEIEALRFILNQNLDQLASLCTEALALEEELNMRT